MRRAKDSLPLPGLELRERAGRSGRTRKGQPQPKQGLVAIPFLNSFRILSPDLFWHSQRIISWKPPVMLVAGCDLAILLRFRCQTITWLRISCDQSAFTSRRATAHRVELPWPTIRAR